MNNHRLRRHRAGSACAFVEVPYERARGCVGQMLPCLARSSAVYICHPLLERSAEHGAQCHFAAFLLRSFLPILQSRRSASHRMDAFSPGWHRETDSSTSGSTTEQLGTGDFLPTSATAASTPSHGGTLARLSLHAIPTATRTTSSTCSMCFRTSHLGSAPHPKECVPKFSRRCRFGRTASWSHTTAGNGKSSTSMHSI